MNKHKKIGWLTYARAVSLMAAVMVLVLTPVAILPGQKRIKMKVKQDDAAKLAMTEPQASDDQLSITGVKVDEGSAESSVQPSAEPTRNPR